jgi:type II secretory pathway pseudopilin PulG
LLEVLLATAILVGGLAVLSQLAAIGRRHADDAQQLTVAQAICQTKLDEILAGLSAPVPVQDQEVEDEPGWRFSIDTEPLRQPGLLAVRVSVVEAVVDRPARRFTAVRWIRDPGYHEGSPPPGLPLPPGFRGGRRR